VCIGGVVTRQDIHFTVEDHILWPKRAISVLVEDLPIEVTQHGVGTGELFDPVCEITGGGAEVKSYDCSESFSGVGGIEFLEQRSRCSTPASGVSRHVENDDVTIEVIQADRRTCVIGEGEVLPTIADVGPSCTTFTWDRADVIGVCSSIVIGVCSSIVIGVCSSIVIGVCSSIVIGVCSSIVIGAGSSIVIGAGSSIVIGAGSSIGNASRGNTIT
jgi:hypothetical protein